MVVIPETRAERLWSAALGLPPPLVLAVAAVVATGLLLLAGRQALEEQDWARVAMVDGRDIDRGTVRDREAVLDFVLQTQAERVQAMVREGRMTPAEAERIQADLDVRLGDVRSHAIADLVGARLIAAEAPQSGQAEVGDLGSELADARIAPAERLVRWVRIGWHPPEGTAVGDGPRGDPAHPVLSEAMDQLAVAWPDATRRSSVAQGLSDVGWIVTSGEGWFPKDGSVSGLEGEAVDAARSATKGGLVTEKGIGWAVVAEVLDVAEPGPVGPQLVSEARTDGVPAGAVEAWLRDRTLAREARQRLSERWLAEPVDLVLAQEVHLGPTDQEGAPGPWVQLAHLATRSVPESAIPAGPGTAAERLRDHLRSLPAADRMIAFRSLIAEAAARDPAEAGELGWFVREQLAPELAAAAFAEGALTHDVVGPIDTLLGPELFLIESRYTGPLDDRTIGALIDLDPGGVEPAVLAAGVRPGMAAYGRTGPWRSTWELGSDFSRQAAVETSIGTPSDPFVLGDEVVALTPLDRRLGVPDANGLARLRVSGFEAWLSRLHEQATVSYADGEGPVPAPSPESSGLPTQLPMGTPRLPVAPPSLTAP